MTAAWTADNQALAHYLQVQALAQRALEIVADALQPGMSEADCEALIRDWLRAHNAFDPARAPRVRFAAAPEPRRFGLFRPSQRRYKHGITYTLQCDAVVNGHVAKAALNGPDTVFASLDTERRAMREQLCSLVAAGVPASTLCARYAGLQLHARPVPLAGDTVPEGLPAESLSLQHGLWQWQYRLQAGEHTLKGCEFMLVDDHGPRWLSDDIDVLHHQPAAHTKNPTEEAA